MISIICVFYEKDMHHIKRFVDMVDDLHLDTEIVFVDNRRIGYAPVETYGHLCVKNSDPTSVYKARKTGFYASHGDFIWFVDIDDVLYSFDPDTLKSEMNVYGYHSSTSYDSVGDLYTRTYLPKTVKIKDNIYARRKNYDFENGVWFKIFKRSLIDRTYKNTKDYMYWVYEDFYLSFSAYMLCDEITYNHEIIYNYIDIKPKGFYSMDKHPREAKACLDLLSTLDKGAVDDLYKKYNLNEVLNI